MLKLGRVGFALALSAAPSFLEIMKGATGSVPTDVDSVLPLEKMYTLHLGMSKLLNTAFEVYAGSIATCTSKGGSVTVGSIFLFLQANWLCDATRSMLHREKVFVTGLRVGFSEANRALQLNGYFTTDGIHDILMKKSGSVLKWCFYLFLNTCTTLLYILGTMS